VRAQFFGALLLVNALLFEANELGDILDAMNDVGHLLVGAKDRRVKRAPMPFLEASASSSGLRMSYFWIAMVSATPFCSTRSREVRRLRTPVADGSLGLSGILRRFLAKNLFALRHGCAQVGIADCDNLEVNGQHQIQPRRRFEYGLKVEAEEGRTESADTFPKKPLLKT